MVKTTTIIIEQIQLTADAFFLQHSLHVRLTEHALSLQVHASTSNNKGSTQLSQLNSASASAWAGFRHQSKATGGRFNTIIR